MDLHTNYRICTIQDHSHSQNTYNINTYTYAYTYVPPKRQSPHYKELQSKNILIRMFFDPRNVSPPHRNTDYNKNIHRILGPKLTL